MASSCSNHFSNPRIVRCHKNLIQEDGLLGALQDMKHQRPPTEGGQRLLREALGRQPDRDDAEDRSP